MFDDELLDKIFSHPEVQKVPLVYQSIMVHAVEDALEEKEDADKSELSE